MQNLQATGIKLGILSYIRKMVTLKKNNADFYFSVGTDLRGILFTEYNGNARDIMYPVYKYPILETNSVSSATIAITKSEDISPLLQYCGLAEFSYDELISFAQTILLDPKWLDENEKLFGLSTKKYGPIKIQTDLNIQPKFERELGELIGTVQQLDGFQISKKEQKIFQLK